MPRVALALTAALLATCGCATPPEVVVHLAVELGRDVDKPRNLAKSVTVE